MYRLPFELYIYICRERERERQAQAPLELVSVWIGLIFLCVLRLAFLVLVSGSYALFTRLTSCLIQQFFLQNYVL